MSQKTPAPACAVWRKMIWLLLCVAALIGAPGALALQDDKTSAASQEDRAALYQALLDLSNPWTVMCVAAHPDDEDGATLTVLRRKYGAHTVTVFSTYGEGGQNATGPELYEELGAIRARETLAAAQIQGSEPSFLALRDFGFSKSADEAFRIWGHDEALRRMVLKIRTLRPDVIITNHDTVSGHGQHQATGRLVLEAFDAAADPRRFPEQLGQPGVRVWQVKRLFVRVNYENGTGSKAAEEAAERAGKVIVINPNERDAVRGTTYAEQALQALHQHASQGPWPATVPKDGAPTIRYRLARESKDASHLPVNATTFFDGLTLRSELKAMLSPPMIEQRPLSEFINEPTRIFDALITEIKKGGRRSLRRRVSDNASESANEATHLEQMRNARQNLLAASSGLKVTFTPDETIAAPSSYITFDARFINDSDKTATIKSVHYLGLGIDTVVKIREQLTPRHSVTITQRVQLPRDAAINLPFAEHLYDGLLFGQSFTLVADVEMAGYEFSLPDMQARVNVAPNVEIVSSVPSPYVFTPANLNLPLTFRIRLVNYQNKPFKGEFGISSPSEHINEVGPDIALAANETREFTVRTNVIPVDTPDEQRTPRTNFGPIIFSVYSPKSATAITQRASQVVYSNARVALKLRVGYVRSFDDTLRNALAALGVDAKELTVDEVQASDLQRYDTIIIDNRGYQAHPELVAANTRLLEYARAGGTLIVFYHKASEWNPDPQKQRPQLAPYPITLGTSRVTDETAPVTFTEPQSALLNFPNKIEAKDFDGWIQERGLYYPKEWDARYSAPLSMSDAGEAPLRGGLLVADYGRGRYIYTSMVWYRQLRAGVPGAYRVFANMISYGHAGAK